MTTQLCFSTPGRWRRARAVATVAAYLIVAAIGHVRQARAEQLEFFVDSSQSYLSLAIPNFTVASNSVNITGQNRTNGAPVTGAWTTTTGNRASISGTFKADLGGSVSPGGVTSIQFVNGTANLVALNSGNYRPNPAAYNSGPPPTSPYYANNTPAAAAYGGTIHISLGNIGLFSLSNATYALSSAAAIPVAANQFSVNLPGNALTTGLSTTTFSLYGPDLFIGPVLTSERSSLTGLSASDTSSTKGTVLVTTGLVKVTIPITVPFSIPLGGGGPGSYLNGTGTGQIVAFYMPEPSTIYLGGLGALFIGGAWHRARQQAARRFCVAPDTR